jgi:hypothetical protein
MNYLVETKKEYTTQLINIILPFIFDGMQSLYEEACKVSKENEELKIFQSFLKKIPSWNNLILETENARILKESGCEDLLSHLLLAVIKSNIMVLTNTPPDHKHTIKLPSDIDFKKFIHFAYIETAKTIYDNPYLFYHKFSVFDVKKNQRDARESIKSSIHEAIRKLLPLQYILKEYLHEETSEYPKSKEHDFDKTISEANKSLLKKMLKIQELDEPPSSGVVAQLDQLKQMLKNDPLDTDSISETVGKSSEQFKKSKQTSPTNPTSPTNSTSPTNPTSHTSPPIINKTVSQYSNSVKKNSESEKKQVPYVLKKIKDLQPDKVEENDISESIPYYKNNTSKLIDSFSNKSNIRSVFYSNEPENNKTKSINTADVEKYLKEQGQTTIKMSDDPNINSIKNINPEKFKNKYYQV